MLRLSRIINDLLGAFEIDLTQLKTIIDSETAVHRGAETLDLSLYGIIIQSVINQVPSTFEKVFKRGYRLKSKGIFVPSEISTKDIVIEDRSKLIQS